MSSIALQRVVVRMLHDPGFVEAVYADPVSALRGVDVTEEERTWLLRPDRRAYGIDSMRRHRGLTLGLEEYPVASVLVLRATGRIEALDAHFSSEAFHRSIQERGSLGVEFGRWLIAEADRGAFGDPRVAPVARIETAIARLRRVAGAPRTGERWITSPRVVPLAVPAGSLAFYEEVRSRIDAAGKGPVATILDPAFEVPASNLGPGDEALLIEDAGGVGIGIVSPELIALLCFASVPRSREELVLELGRLDVDAGDRASIIESLIDEGLLVNS